VFVDYLRQENDAFFFLFTGRQEEFTDQLARMSQSEAIFLLTTFANIATSRDEKEKELIEAITVEVYKVWNIAFKLITFSPMYESPNLYSNLF